MRRIIRTLAFVLTSVLLATSIQAEIDPYPIEYVSSTLWTRSSHEVVQGSYAYLGMRYGTMIVDISDPTMCLVVATLEFPGGTESGAMGISGGYLFAVNQGDSTFNTINLSDPADPQIIGSCKMRSRTFSMIVSGGYAYVAEGEDGVEVVDISDPANPAVVGHMQTNHADEVVVENDVMYVADYDDAKIIDISNLEAPVTLAVYDSINRVRDLALDGTLLYLVDSDAGLKILDVTDPSSPYLVCDFEIDHCGDVAIVDHYAYVSGGSAGIQIYDVADPENPSYQGSIPSQGWTIMEVDGFLYVQETWSEFQIWDITAAPSYTLAGAFEPTRSWVCAVDTYGDYVYACAGDVHVVDVSDPSTPLVVYKYNTQGLWNPQGVEVSDGYAFVVDGTGLEVLDLSDPAVPTFAARLALDVSDISVDNGYAALAGGGSTHIVDISDPTDPSSVGAYSGSWFTRGVKLLDGYVYICISKYEGDSELHVVDVSVPSSPQLESVYSCYDFNFCAIDVVGSYVYLHSGYSFQVIDVSEPASPTQVAVRGSGSITEIEVIGDFAYLSDIDNGFTVLDVYYPQFPREIAKYSTSGKGRGLAISGDCAHVADEYGLLVFSAPVPDMLIGDADGSGQIDIDDIVFLVEFIFSDGPLPLPTRLGDMDSSGLIDIDDVVALIALVFGG